MFSVQTAGIALIFIVIFGVAMALLLARREFMGKNALETAITLPLVLPPVATGFLLLLVVGRQGPIGWFLNRYFQTQLVFTPYAAILAAVVVAYPLMVQSAKAAIISVDRAAEDAARTLGSGELKVFLTVTLPMAWPGLVSGMVLAFCRALGEFGATSLIAGNIPGKTQTIPVAIYFAAESGELSAASSYVLVIAAITFVLIFGVNRWLGSFAVEANCSERGMKHARSSESPAVAGVSARHRISNES